MRDDEPYLSSELSRATRVQAEFIQVPESTSPIRLGRLVAIAVVLIIAAIAARLYLWSIDVPPPPTEKAPPSMSHPMGSNSAISDY